MGPWNYCNQVELYISYQERFPPWIWIGLYFLSANNNVPWQPILGLQILSIRPESWATYSGIIFWMLNTLCQIIENRSVCRSFIFKVSSQKSFLKLLLWNFRSYLKVIWSKILNRAIISFKKDQIVNSFSRFVWFFFT